MTGCIGSTDETAPAVAWASSWIQEIKHAMDEQTGGLIQINAAVVRLDSMTPQIAAMVKQSAAAPKTLSAGGRSFPNRFP